MTKPKLEQRAKEQRTQGRFIVALPFVDMNVPEYPRINHKGGRVATTSGGAVSQYVFERINAEVIARTILANLRDKYGGVGAYAMRVPEVYTDENGNALEGSNRITAEEIEVASYFARCYGRDPRTYLDETRQILRSLNRINKRVNKNKDK
jgi:hypothetical protein